MLNTLRPETRGRPTQDQILRAAQETGLYVAPRQPGGLSRYNRARRDEKRSQVFVLSDLIASRSRSPSSATSSVAV